MIWIFRAILLFVAFTIFISIPVFFYDKSQNKHSRVLWGLLENFPDEKKVTDTSVPKSQPTVSSYDTPLNNTSVKTAPLKNSVNTHKKEGITALPQKENTTNNIQKIDSGGSGIQNNAPNFGNQAGRDQYNYGIIPRKMDEVEIMLLMNNNFPKKDIGISFSCFGGADAEVTSVKNQLISIFKKNGYTNIDSEFKLKVGFTPPQAVSFRPVKNENALLIEIPPAH